MEAEATLEDQPVPQPSDKPAVPKIISEISLQLYANNTPLKFADPAYRDDGYPSTNLSRDIVQSILNVVKPKFWLEVGSMLGGSANITADMIKSLGLDTEIVCVDPWVGDVYMWELELPLLIHSRWRYLLLDRGRPTILDRFCANVQAAGHSDIIIPISATSIVGMRLLRRLFEKERISSQPDVIYLDSAHEPDETYLELKTAWNLLRDGGVLFGDDWSWEAVRNDVQRFSAEIDVNSAQVERLMRAHPDYAFDGKILLSQGQWILAK